MSHSLPFLMQHDIYINKYHKPDAVDKILWQFYYLCPAFNKKLAILQVANKLYHLNHTQNVN